MGTKVRLVISVVLMALLCSLVAQPLSEEKASLLDNLIQSLMECRHFGPGVSIVMVKDNDIVYNKTYGVADIETDEELTVDHRFCIASVTKTFTSTLLAAVLTENPQFSFNSRIQDVLGNDFKLHDELRTEYGMLEDLLAHRMGSQRFDGPRRIGEFIEMSRSELLDRLQFLEEVVPFRTEYSYNNYYYALAGRAAEIIDGSGKTYEKLVKEALLDPLHMESAVFMSPDLDPAEWETIAKPHAYVSDEGFARVDKIVVEIVHPAEPAGGICVKPTDMVQWMLFHLGNGTNPEDGSEMVSAELFQQLHKEHQQYNWFIGQPIIPVTITTVGYGLGFYSATYRGFRGLYHDGALTGYNAEMLVLPDVNAGVFISNNGPTDAENILAMQLAVFTAVDILLELDPWLDNTTACSFPFPEAWGNVMQGLGKESSSKETTQKWNAARTSLRSLEDYVGDYRHHFGGTVHISHNTTMDSLHFEMGLGTGHLEPLDSQKDAFFLSFYGLFWHLTHSTLRTDAVLYFKEDEENPEEITSVEIPWLSPDKHPVFFKNLAAPTDAPVSTTPTCPDTATSSVPVCRLLLRLCLLLVYLVLL